MDNVLPCFFQLCGNLCKLQVYNIDKRLQEDNLQHLALFSEYGRMALDGTDAEEDKKSKNKKKDDNDDDAELEEKSDDGSGQAVVSALKDIWASFAPMYEAF